MWENKIKQNNKMSKMLTVYSYKLLKNKIEPNKFEDIIDFIK